MSIARSITMSRSNHSPASRRRQASTYMARKSGRRRSQFATILAVGIPGRPTTALAAAPSWIASQNARATASV